MRLALIAPLSFVHAAWTPPELRHVPELQTVPIVGDNGIAKDARLGVIVGEVCDRAHERNKILIA